MPEMELGSIEVKEIELVVLVTVEDVDCVGAVL